MECSSSWSSHSSFAVGYFCFHTWWKYSYFSRYSSWICYLNYLPSLSLNIKDLSLSFHVFLLQENFCSIPWTLLLSHWLRSHEIIFFSWYCFLILCENLRELIFSWEQQKLASVLQCRMSWKWIQNLQFVTYQEIQPTSFVVVPLESFMVMWNITKEFHTSWEAPGFYKIVVCSVYQDNISCPGWIKVDFFRRQIVAISFSTNG